jgi:hypothetical protein
MSILILGGDNIDPIRKVLMSLGVTNIIHWTERRKKRNRQKDRALPSQIDMVVMLTNFLNHTSMKYYKAQAKAKGLPVVYGTRNVECVKSAFIQAVHNLDKDSPLCKQCENYIKCYQKDQ